VLLSLTDKGQREFVALNGASDEQISSLAGHLNEEQQTELVGHMEAIRRLLHGQVGEVTIRTRLEPGDLGYIAYLHGRIYDKENRFGLGFESYVLEGLGEFGSRYDPEKDRVWVCEHGQEKVGFLVGVHRGEALQLRYFILLPEYRGTGLGKRLMDLFMEYVRERGYPKAYLWTTNEQHAAVSLYTRYGFRLAEDKQSMAFGKPIVERRYEYILI
jgi:peptidyl-dipeptidase Dcp